MRVTSMQVSNSLRTRSRAPSLPVIMTSGRATQRSRFNSGLRIERTLRLNNRFVNISTRLSMRNSPDLDKVGAVPIPDHVILYHAILANSQKMQTDLC